MPAFAALVEALFAGLASFLTRLFIARIGIRVIAVGAITALGTALIALFNTTLSPLAAAAFSTQYGQFLGLAFPPVAGTCLAAIATSWVAITTYRLQVGAIKTTAGI